MFFCAETAAVSACLTRRPIIFLDSAKRSFYRGTTFFFSKVSAETDYSARGFNHFDVFCPISRVLRLENISQRRDGFFFGTTSAAKFWAGSLFLVDGLRLFQHFTSITCCSGHIM